ncbi:helix-turn-helix domain-containing protein [Bacillus mycoides]|uniref:helix-turn-helix domain-containing protein n=1 Tax=Bacillus mycoides TaxID=1405 RepID=UPI003D64FC49
MIKMEFINKEEVRLAIAEKGMTLKDFSSYIGISPVYLTQILKGDKNPSPTVSAKIAKGLGVEINEIFQIRFHEKEGI